MFLDILGGPKWTLFNPRYQTLLESCAAGSAAWSGPWCTAREGKGHGNEGSMLCEYTLMKATYNENDDVTAAIFFFFLNQGNVVIDEW